MIVIEYFKCRVLFYCGGLDENINCWGDERSKNKWGAFEGELIFIKDSVYCKKGKSEWTKSY